MGFFILLFIALFFWLFVVIYKLKNRLSTLETAVSRLDGRLRESVRTEEPLSGPPIPAEPLQPEVSIPSDTGMPADAASEPPSPFAGLPGTPPGRTLEDRFNYFEQLVGTRWLNWVGAVVMLVGTAFLLKFLYDRGWIGPAGRVSIGMGIGVALLFLGEIKLRRFHDLFSQSVSAAGCGALFLTAFLSFKFYEFSGRTATFALLCWFALFSVALAIVRRGAVLAFLGLLCAYLTPYLLSTGQDQAEMLFAYLAVLALAVAGINIARNWRGIVSLCFAFSWIYYVGWFLRFYSSERLPIAAAGAVGLTLLAGAAALLRGLWTGTPVRTEECVVTAAAAISGIAHLWYVLSDRHELTLGFVLCGITLLALAVLKISLRRRASTPVLESTLLGIASGSLLLTIPACLKANGAMLAWALAGVIFADMALRARRVPLEIAAGICLLAGIRVGFVQNVGHSGIFFPVANPVFLAWFGIGLAWFVVGFRYFRSSPATARRNSAGLALQIASSVILIGLLSYEAFTWFRGQIRYPGADAPFLLDCRTAVLSLLWAVFPWLWLFRARVRSRLYDLSAFYYAALGPAFLLLLIDFHHRNTVVFLNPVFLAALLFPAGVFLISSRIDESRQRMRYGFQIYAHLLCVILIAVEITQGMYLRTWSGSSRDWIRMALISVGWASYATVLLGIGISRNLRPWRWLALGLLGATLIKVIFLDMAAARQIWRVLSFLALGALLMICSYVYSRHERMKRAAGTVTAPDKR